MNMRHFIAAAIALISFPAFADRQEDIKRVEAYLTSLTTIVADFNQIDAGGALSSGKFYLKRPGKMRWQYTPPVPILLVSNGDTITYYDAELDQVNYIPIDDTLAGFLASPVIKLNSKSTKLTDFQSKAGVIRATIVQKGKENEGALTLEFVDKPLQIKQMTVTDAGGGQTHIQLLRAQFSKPLPDDMFKFEDPRGIVKRRPRDR